jgi:periplasmic protein TonB
MLSETLLDSSPTREPVLQGRHWLVAVAAAVAGFCLAWFGLLLAEAPLTKMLATQSLILAAVFFFSALMLVYVYADSRHLRLRTWPWIMLTSLLNIGGFIAYLVYSAAKTGNWKRASLPLAYTIEVMVIGLMIIIPLVYTEALPKASLAIAWIPSPSTAPPRATPLRRIVVPKVSMEDLEKQPVLIPKTIAQFKRQPLPPSSGIEVPGAMPEVPGGPSVGVLSDMAEMIADPPPLPPLRAQTIKRIWRGGVVERAMLIYGPKPNYPQLAKFARVHGTVRLEAVIATDGTIKNLKVKSGHPLLVKAALEAVEQWRYQPTLLNGQPVEVETEIDVNFALGQ